MKKRQSNARAARAELERRAEERGGRGKGGGHSIFKNSRKQRLFTATLKNEKPPPVFNCFIGAKLNLQFERLSPLAAGV